MTTEININIVSKFSNVCAFSFIPPPPPHTHKTFDKHPFQIGTPDKPFTTPLWHRARAVAAPLILARYNICYQKSPTCVDKSDRLNVPKPSNQRWLIVVGAKPPHGFIVGFPSK